MDIIRRCVLSGALLALCLAGATGCMQKTSGTEVIGVMNAPEDSGMSRAIIVNNAKFGRTVQVVDIRHETAGDLLKVNVVLTSKYAGSTKFQYKFAWFNAGGLEVLPNTDAWTPVILHGNETITIQGVAPTPEVKSFKVNIRN